MRTHPFHIVAAVAATLLSVSSGEAREPLDPADTSRRIEVGTTVKWLRHSRGSELAGGVVLTWRGDWASSKAKEPPRGSKADANAAAPSGEVTSHAKRALPRPTGTLPRLRPRDARAAVSAALRHRQSSQAQARLDDLASRSRWSAALPELRLRAMRVIDDSSSLSPTAYDPERVTIRGGVSTWLEARTSWSLDRLVFRDDEVRIERLRLARARDDERFAQGVTRLLYAWHTAVFLLRHASTPYPRCMQAWLDEQHLGAELSVVTGGWFAKWRKQRGLSVGADPCADRIDMEAPPVDGKDATPRSRQAPSRSARA